MHDSWVDEQDMNAADLISDFYASHPTAIHSCIKDTGNPDKEYLSCPNALTLVTLPSRHTTSSACSSGILLSTPSHTTSKSSCLPLESQHHSNAPFISPTHIPSSTSVAAKNTTAPTTTRYHSTQTSPAQAFPHLPSSPLALKMALYLSGYTP